jgi:hypothetical protein
MSILLLLLYTHTVVAATGDHLKVQVSCPDLTRVGSKRDAISCSEPPVRFQILIPKEDIGCDYTPTASENDDSSSGENSLSAMTGGSATYDKNCPTCPMGYTSQSLTPKCTKLLGYCTDDRDCCSHYCNYDTGKCESYQRRSLRSSAAKSRQLAPHSLSYYNEYLYDDSSNICASNSDCLSFRCVDGYCDDETSSNYVTGNGCDDNFVSILYTLQLSLDADVNVGEPDWRTNPEYTQEAMPGEFVDVSFPGTIVIKYRTETCNEFSCNMTDVKTYTINVGSTGHETDPTKISKDNKPAAGGNFSYIRSAVVFKSFVGGAGKFNRTGFVRAIVDAINYDRLIYVPGVAKHQLQEEFRKVPPKAVSIIVIDPKEKLVQYEVRVLKTDSNAVRNRLLHSYFKFPLVLRLSFYGILGPINVRPFSFIDIDSSNSFTIESEPIYINETQTVTQSKYASIKEVLGVEGILGIAVSVFVFICCSLFVFWRFCKQQKTAKDQLKKEHELQDYAKQLTAKEKEINMKLQQVEEEREQLLKLNGGIKNERDSIRAQAMEAEKKLKLLQENGADTTGANDLKTLENEIDEENLNELITIEQKCKEEEIEIMEKLKNGDNVTLPLSPTFDIDAANKERMNSEIDTLVLNANMDAEQVSKQLKERKERMLARTRERNKARKKKKLAEKEELIKETNVAESK